MSDTHIFSLLFNVILQALKNALLLVGGEEVLVHEAADAQQQGVVIGRLQGDLD